MDRKIILREHLRDSGYRYVVSVLKFCDILPKDTATQNISANLSAAAVNLGVYVRQFYESGSESESLENINKAIRAANTGISLLMMLKDEQRIKGRKINPTRLNQFLKDTKELIQLLTASKLAQGKPRSGRGD